MADGGSDMVERVARAIHYAHAKGDGAKLLSADEFGNDVKAARLEQARAAIAGMREPTAEILALSKRLAGNELCWDADEAVVARVLSAIIDAALGKSSA